VGWYYSTLIAFITTIAIHSVFCRYFILFDRVIKFIAVFIPIWICLATVLASKYGLFTLPTFTGILTYSFLCELYVFLFTMILSSISTNILYRLSNGQLSLDKAIDMYSSSDMVENRITRLIESGFLTKTGDKLLPTPKAVKLMYLFIVAKKIFKH